MMTKERNDYDREFKQKAVELSLARGNAKEIAEELEISPDLLYRWLKEGPSRRWQEDERLLVEIMDIFEGSKESYGSARMTRELRARGWTVGKNKVAGMMRAAGLHAKRKRKFKITTDSKHNYPVAPNLLDQEFTATRPGEVWVSDITYGVPVSLQFLIAATRAYLKYTFVSMPCCEGI